MGVDVDAGILRLFEELLEVFQVVPRHQDARPISGGGLDGGDLGVAVDGRVRPVEQSKGRDTDTSALEDQSDHLVDREVPDGGGEPLDHELLDRIVLVPEHHGVVVVGAHPFHAVDEGLAKRADVFVLGREDADRGRLRIDLGVILRSPGGDIVGTWGCRRQGVTDRDCFPDHLPDPNRVEVYVRERREERFGDKIPGLFTSRPAGITGCQFTYRDPAADVQQDIHQPAEFLVLAADTTDRTPGPPCCLLALVTEHVYLTPRVVFLQGIITIPTYKYCGVTRM